MRAQENKNVRDVSFDIATRYGLGGQGTEVLFLVGTKHHS
jgi:hypothetical protein